jgi:cold shock CspA family protein
MVSPRGFFFIRPESGDSDIFGHRSSLPADVRELPVGARVEFELGIRNGRPLATDVVVLS